LVETPNPNAMVQIIIAPQLCGKIKTNKIPKSINPYEIHNHSFRLRTKAVIHAPGIKKMAA